MYLCSSLELVLPDFFFSPNCAHRTFLCFSYHTQLPWGFLQPSCAQIAPWPPLREHVIHLPLSQFCILDTRCFCSWIQPLWLHEKVYRLSPSLLLECGVERRAPACVGSPPFPDSIPPDEAPFLLTFQECSVHSLLCGQFLCYEWSFGLPLSDGGRESELHLSSSAQTSGGLLNKVDTKLNRELNEPGLPSLGIHWDE